MSFIEDGIVLEKVETQEDKKTVFLIGDSIRMRYCGIVKEELGDIANVIYPAENCRFTQNVITNIYNWATLCDPTKVAVVQFNCGHWDIAHWRGDAESLNTIDTYCHNIVRIINMIKKIFPNAKIVFATTTTMNPSGKQGVNPRTNEEIRAYNQAAVAVCGEDILINDLYAVAETFGEEMYDDYCHPGKEGAMVLGKAVAEYIRKLL